MNILITTGTTEFGELLRYFDVQRRGLEIRLQGPTTSFQPAYSNHEEFYPDINSQYLWADLIVCHAGAGTVFSLLELNKKLIVVPNIEREDKHQLELASYLRTNGYARVIDIKELYSRSVYSIIESAMDFKPRSYLREEFDSYDWIMDYFCETDK